MPSKTASADIDPEFLDRPKLAADVSVHEPAEEGGPWLIQQGQRKYFRVEADLARLVLALNGTRDHALLADILGTPWTVEAVGTAVDTLAKGHLLDNGEPVRTSNRWVKFVPPLTVQFTLLRPDGLLKLASPLVRLLSGRAGRVTALVVALGGLLALAAQSREVGAVLGRPLPLSTYLVVVAGILATTAIHEFGHGAVLSHYGGRPARMGVMLFYLSPAFFCDVSDGWRLPRKEQRVAVALAGIATQVVIAGATATASPFFHGMARDGLIVFAIAAYTSGLLNLAPFVKLDGYIALMSHLDIPHLRDHTLTDARRWIARVLFGGSYERRLPELRWAVPFGLACMVFPMYLIATGVRMWGDSLQRMGFFGSWLLLGGLGYLLYHLGRGAGRLVRDARAGGARPLRIGVVTLFLAAAATAVLGLVKVPYTVTGGYAVRAGGQVELLLPLSADLSVIRENTAVRLIRAGAAVRTEIGQAVVADARGTETTAPLSAFLPVRTDGLPLPAQGYRLTTAVVPEDEVGVAEVASGDRPLGAWLYAHYVAPALRW
ncbi:MULTISPECIES: daptide biosynthesis intramembrane metalloprotease [unclassified Streptomyces]|uniref:daptide biosynthesis intramembrane metalloprotease n=1 Tax=unclassified Streptomyces TaxID=2593676 RepID=UPI0016607816|nr:MULTISPECIES: daptide biosynthesis intramembrane metalloprotease [unclassified Streptomyces]MBD0706875.1 hypothetical protein [Streptomyces sp. CBMA291]MBD0715011.1 hypothetical protein [Streptomyces sp. CBMA370]